MHSMPKTTPKVTQAMIQLYDEYTHLTLDRRGFMEKLAKLAGSGAAAAAIAPMLMPDYARAAIVASDDARLDAADITFAGPAARPHGLSRQAGRGERQAAGRRRHPREPRAQSRISRT